MRDQIAQAFSQRERQGRRHARQPRVSSATRLAPSPTIRGYEAPSKLTAGRLAAGSITQDQANNTAEQQSLLEQAFGPEWRTHVFGGRGIVAANNKALAGGSGSAQELAFHDELMKDRRRALEQAARKLGGIQIPGMESNPY